MILVYNHNVPNFISYFIPFRTRSMNRFPEPYNQPGVNHRVIIHPVTFRVQPCRLYFNGVRLKSDFRNQTTGVWEKRSNAYLRHLNVTSVKYIKERQI